MGETEDYIITIAPLPATPNAPIQANTPNCATGGDLAAVGSAPPGETWYWQTSASGTSTAFPASSNYNILANGTYYLRSQSNAYLVWSTASSSITVTNFPVGPTDPTTSAPTGNPACGSVTLVSSVAASGSTNYWQGTDATGTSLALLADDGSSNNPFNAPASGTYYLRARDNSSFCWSNNVATTATILAVPTAPILGATPSSICPSGNSALTAIAPSAPPTGYSVASIPFAPISAPGSVNAGPIGDDVVSGTIPIGFPFNFYGNTYTNFVISTNGFISFDAAPGSGCCSGGIIPTAGGPNNLIAAMWDDLYVGSPNSIDYFNLTSPNRLVVRYNNVSPCCSTTPAQYDGQIIVYESGIIEVHTTSATNGGTTTQGIEGPGGLAGTAVPGRNATGWTASNDAYRFSPIQAMGFLWSPNGPGSGIAAGNEVLANTSASPSTTTTYTMTLTDPLNGCTNSGTVVVNVLPVPPAPSATGGSTPCGVGSATLTATGTGGTLNWYDVASGGSILGTGSTFNTPSIGANTTYYVEETNGTCNSTRTAVLATYTPSDPISASSNVSYVCTNGANLSANLSASSTNGNYNYTWNPGGLTGANVTVTPGTTTTYTVTGVDGLCSNTATVTINAGLVPTITSTTATPASLCVSGTSQLIVDAGQLAGSYCIPTVGITGGTGDYIESVTFNTLSNLFSGDNPSDYALYPQTTTVTAGSTYALSVTPGAAFGQGIGVWMDFNRNGSFSDAGEFVLASPSGTATVSTNVLVPATASSGLARMRVGAYYATTMSSTQSCGHGGFGEYEDYNITIIGGLSPLSFNWTPAAGLSSTTSDAPTATVSSTSTYSVNVSDALGCSTSSSVTVTVNQPSSSTDNVTTCGAYVWAADGLTYTAAGTYTATSLNAGGCVHTATLNLTIACNTTLNLVCFIEGYWDGTSQMQPVLATQGQPSTTGACDSIDVELHSDVAPYGVDASVRAVLNQNGTATCNFPPMTGNKYIVIKHRNAVQTWSANAELMGTTVNYNFSTAATQAYGANQVQVATGVYALYSGDIVVDENVDLLDLSALETDITAFAFGYLSTDLNGDSNVDLLDASLIEPNVNAFIFSNHP
ncbi:MAG: hypothetical protein IPI46_12095 [Bacteroidetes bacterium]|nr:hypothetical protein [Bacteroidota bacterium]